MRSRQRGSRQGISTRRGPWLHFSWVVMRRGSTVEGRLETGDDRTPASETLVHLLPGAARGDVHVVFAPQIVVVVQIGPGIAVLLVPDVDGPWACRPRAASSRRRTGSRRSGRRRCRRRSRCRSSPRRRRWRRCSRRFESLWMLAVMPCCCSQAATSARVRPPAGRSRALADPSASESAPRRRR